eukprot:GFUD01018898.1.p1 GENE.GFUD01018898.1~~GFUD01018898.1.p1  ORF type:complete len:454 (+),score=103.49 GFUD01018898.1:200-1363(+)
MRSGAENAAFALNGCTLSGATVTVILYYNLSDPQFFSNPAYQSLGQHIGNDHHVMDPNHFQPWGVAPVPPNMAPVLPVAPTQSTFSLQPPTLTLPNYNLGSGFGSMFQSFLGGAQPFQSVQPVVQPSQQAAVPPPGPHQPSSSQASDTLSQYTVPWVQPATPAGEEDQPQCSICLCDLEDNSSYSADSSYAPVLSLNSCVHSFHSACLTALISNSPSPFLQCPTCKKVYGIRTGTRPSTGSMSHRLLQSSLPGHTDCGTIELHFQFTPGIQGPEHPSPGHYYTPVGFPRTAFLPDNQEGQQALHGLYLAWEQRLLFTVGRSITTGQDNCVTWNDIHLKTKVTGGEHSYPDDQYLGNLAQDLAGFGITEAEISTHMGRHPHLRDKGRM